MNGLVFIAAAAIVSGTPDSAELESELFEAVFRQLAWELVRESGVLVCLAIDPGGARQSVSREFLARFRGQGELRRGAECEIGRARVFERATGAPAVMVTAGPIQWIADDEVWVTVEQAWSGSRSTRRPYRVVREKSRWMALGPILRMA